MALTHPPAARTAMCDPPVLRVSLCTGLISIPAPPTHTGISVCGGFSVLCGRSGLGLFGVLGVDLLALAVP